MICPQCCTETHSDNLCKCFICDRQGCKDGQGFKGCMIYDKECMEYFCCEDCEQEAFNRWCDEERARMGEKTWRKEEVDKLTQISKNLRAL